MTMTPEQLLDGHGSHLVERAYILCLQRRCEETRLEVDKTGHTHPDRIELEDYYTDLCGCLERVNNIFNSQGYLTQE